MGVWSFSPFLRYFALGNWKEACTHLAKLIRSLEVGTFTSSSHQADISTQKACHLTHSWGSSKGQLRHCRTIWAHPLYCQVTLSQTRNSHRCGSKAGGSPKSPPADWDQSTVSSELPDNEKQSFPAMGFVRSTVSVVSFESLDRDGRVLSFYQVRPICQFEGCFWAGIQTWIFEGDPPCLGCTGAWCKADLPTACVLQ